MSHISKIKPAVAMKDKEMLIKAMAPLGNIKQNAKIAQVTAGGKSSSKYDLVLENGSHSLGMNKARAGYYEFLYDEWGSLGKWCKKTSTQIIDNYLALHYKQALQQQGYNVEIKNTPNGAIELEAEEAMWA